MRNFGLRQNDVRYCSQCGGDTWHVYGICEHADEHARSLAASSGVMLLIAASLLAALALVLAATAASMAAPGCMTKSEARAQWPTKHIFWHGPERCWDDSPGRGSRKARWLPKPSEDANGNVAHLGGAPLIVEPPQPQLTEAQIDEQQYNEEAERRLTECCWPPMEFLGDSFNGRTIDFESINAGSIPASPASSFAERWSAIPSNWQLVRAAGAL